MLLQSLIWEQNVGILFSPRRFICQHVPWENLICVLTFNNHIKNAKIHNRRGPRSVLLLSCDIIICTATLPLNSISRIISTQLPEAQDRKRKHFGHSELTAEILLSNDIFTFTKIFIMLFIHFDIAMTYSFPVWKPVFIRHCSQKEGGKLNWRI